MADLTKLGNVVLVTCTSLDPLKKTITASFEAQRYIHIMLHGEEDKLAAQNQS